MNKQKKIGLVFIPAFLGLFLWLWVPGLSQPEDFKIYQTDARIQIDGLLDEWEGIEEIPVNLTLTGEEVAPSQDIAVTVRFTYDVKNFYVAVEAADDTFEFPSRGWRYGDGFFLTFIDPAQGTEGDSFYSFGISQGEKFPEKVVVYKDGIGFPGIDLRDMELAIVPDEKKGVITYELSIPFQILVPFRPFMMDRWAINLVYADRDMGNRELLQLYPDPSYDSEMSNRRKGRIFEFVNRIPEKPEIQMLIDSTHFYDDSQKTITLAIHSPEDKTGWQLRTYLLGPGATNVQQKEEFSFKEGMSQVRFDLEEREFQTGIYDLSVGVIDEQGALNFKEDTRFFVLKRADLEEARSALEEAKKSARYAEDEKFRNSLPNLEARLVWIDVYMEKAPPHMGIASIDEWIDEIETLVERIAEGKPAFFPLGSVGRYAHRSVIDGTLQPYTIFVPKDYDEEVPVALLVVLHGSGVDEVNYALDMARLITEARVQLQIPKMMMIAPQARGLSDWYLGDSAKDVLECIEHVKTLYSIDEKNIILQGFSMGGYGAWRLSLLNPDLFHAAIILSGATSPPSFLKGEKIIDLIDRAKGKKLNYFIVHGAKDNAVPVEDTRKIVQKLKEMGIPHEYIEIKDAYHTGYNKWVEIFRWLKNVVNQYKRIIR